mmetsp:Transcript_968/g.1835  ORF Transcript_968/g.1835 Transcript_968/m.1835 type:complete len:494 (-) Transcript_968:172-1653(-)|eukprot:CAMPEP_0167785752 /NCGR_PEP_ID=MMETSP0111_2-20121227/8400_1 /TAXON_ID=91324 /ORGANISM="Lotharella globosa, Strain CCCM811" /LENGTH=493 /DNA_ID=CAMNT_0007677035 /DNA_START=42 /DNA_END=1523 /DNA_ORIENTATION=+
MAASDGVERHYPKPPVRTLASLAFCAALDAADFSMIPGMFTAFSDDFGASLSDIGLMYLLQCLVGACAMPVWGGLGDRMSRKNLLCIGCFTWGLFTLGCATAQSFMAFTMFRTLAAVFMSLVSPIAQSVVADLVPSKTRGSLFGQIGFFAMLGAFVGQFASTSLSDGYVGGMRGWRFCLLVVGGLSVVWPFVMIFLMVEPNRDRAIALARHANNGSSLNIDWPSLRLYSFWLLVLQGIFGCMPWRAFGMFSILWLQLIGFSDFQVAIIGGAGMIAGAIGHLFAGYIGDYSHSILPYRGRVYVAQFTVAIGMFMVFFLLVLLPKTPNMAVFLSVIIGFNLTATWASNATNRPLVADIVPEWSRASIYSYFTMMESVPSSFAGYFVSYLAESVFGFKMAGHGHHQDVSDLTPEERAENVASLTNALVIMTMVPWVLCFGAYGLMHYTYEKDVLKTKKRLEKASLAAGSPSELALDDDEEIDGLEKVNLLAEGRRG